MVQTKGIVDDKERNLVKYKGFIDIDKPRDTVVELFSDPKYLGEYQDGFIKKELVSGKMGKNGAVSKMYYKLGKGEMELTETIVANQLPDTFEAFYHHKHMDNTMKCNFVALGDNKTRYEYEFEYTRISWVIPKLMAIFFTMLLFLTVSHEMTIQISSEVSKTSSSE